jgi:hypothetical protein
LNSVVEGVRDGESHQTILILLPNIK